MTEITENDAFRKVAAYCAAAEHCRAEIVEKMQRWGLPYEVVNRVADRLEQEKYIDEERFCRAFVRDKYRLAKWGKVKIGQALQLKKIPRLVYLPLLNEIDEADYLSVLQGLLASKRKRARRKRIRTECQTDTLRPEPRFRAERHTAMHRYPRRGAL